MHWPINLLPSLSKVFRKIIHQQLNSFSKRKYPLVFRDFHSRYDTEHAFLNLMNKWQCWLDKSKAAGTILMDFSNDSTAYPINSSCQNGMSMQLIEKVLHSFKIIF